MRDFDYYDQEGLEEIKHRIYKAALLRHPHCSDPDHPGCVDCEEED